MFLQLTRAIFTSLFENLSNEYFGLNHMIIKIIFMVFETIGIENPNFYLLIMKESFNIALYPNLTELRLNIFMNRFLVCEEVR